MHRFILRALALAATPARAGAQRSGPKTGDAADYPESNGPQGGAIRVLNYVRPVRDNG